MFSWRRCSSTALAGRRVLSPEPLLAALDACGVDNARIEIEGGEEIPIVDGSALGWAVDVRAAGVKPAEGADPANIPIETQSPDFAIFVHEGDSFISFVPGPTPRYTAGVEFQAPVIGRQWHCWRPELDLPFRHEIAPARRHLDSLEEAKRLIDEGLMLGGPDRVVALGAGTLWADPRMSSMENEAARFAIQHLLGVLSLAAPAGSRAEPRGHIVMFNAPLELQLRFAQRFVEAAVSEGTES